VPTGKVKEVTAIHAMVALPFQEDDFYRIVFACENSDEYLSAGAARS
jgi:hypothetical protein